MNKIRTLVLSVCCTGAAVQASMVNYYYETTDNGSAIGVEDGYNGIQTLGWKDSSFHEGSYTSDGEDGLLTIAEEKTGFAPASRFIGLISFGDLNLNDSSVIDYATLHLYFSNTDGATSWTIMGLAAADADWDESSTVYDSEEWSGGTVEDSLSGSYGTFSTDGSDAYWAEIDVSDAVRAYADGEISGIAFINNTGTDEKSATFASNENADTSLHGGLEVAIPEPATITFICIFGGGFLISRRIFEPKGS